MRTLFQRGQVVTIESSLPAIERLPADAEVPTGPPHVPPIKGIEQHPLKPGLCARLSRFPSRCSHPDTLPSVTNHSERAHTLARRRPVVISLYPAGPAKRPYA